jgi:hypothetical protein
MLACARLVARDCDLAVPRSELSYAFVTAALLACRGSPATSSDARPPALDATSVDGNDASVFACPPGSTRLADRTMCASSVVVPPPSLLSSNAAAGDLVSLDGLDEGALPCVRANVCGPDDAATMLFSDDPESPSSDGVLYADTFGPGRARIYVYHVNGGAGVRKFPIVVLNQNATDAHVTITKLGLAPPSTDYIDVGKAVASSWMSSTLAKFVTVPANTRVLLDATLDGEDAATGELVHAIVDIDVDAPLKISIVSVLANEDAAAITSSLPLLPYDGLHDRGTFAGADVWIVGGAGGEGPSARHLRLGANVTESDLTGRDATTGAPAALRGNYVVAYRFVIDALGSVRLAASERGGAWAGAANTGAVVPLPTANGALSTTTDAVWLATLAAGRADCTLMSAGGSSLPVDLVVLTQ